MNVSPRHLTRLVSRFTGVGPAAYIAKARIQRARTLLLRTDDPVKQVGSQVGYDDVHHFTRAFTRLVGCPPAAFRKTRGEAALSDSRWRKYPKVRARWSKDVLPLTLAILKPILS